MITFKFIVLYIVIPGILGGIFAPKLVNVCNKLWDACKGSCSRRCDKKR